MSIIVDYPFYGSNWVTQSPGTGTHQYAAYDFDVPIAGNDGWEVQSVAEGVVISVREYMADNVNIPGSYGNYITIGYNIGTSDQYYITYAHLQQFSVLPGEGDTVYAGSVIGLAGNTGDSTAIHLHFQFSQSLTDNGLFASTVYDNSTFDLLSFNGATPGIGSVVGTTLPRYDYGSFGDDYAGDTSTTGALNVGGTVTANIETTGDTDWFSINLVAGQQYVFDLEGSPTGQGTLSDSFLRLRDSDGNYISFNDDGGTGYNSQISFTATTTAVYFLSTGSYNNGTGTYTLSASVIASSGLFSQGDDVVTLSAGGGVFNGLGGDDIVSGTVFGETIYGGSGDDMLFGYGGNDFLFGGLGNDIIVGGSAADQLDGGEGIDWLYGLAGDDIIYAGAGFVDVVIGGDGNDTVYGQDGIDYIFGNAGNDVLYGGNGVDIFFAGADSDTIYGEADTDWLFGGAGDDNLYGGANPDLLFGDAGADRIDAGIGNDWIWGGASDGLGDGAADTFVFGANWGVDVIYDFENGIDKIDLSASGATSFADVSVGQIAGGFTWIAYGADVIYLWGAGNVNVGSGNIDASDFIF